MNIHYYLLDRCFRYFNGYFLIYLGVTYFYWKQAHSLSSIMDEFQLPEKDMPAFIDMELYKSKVLLRFLGFFASITICAAWLTVLD